MAKAEKRPKEDFEVVLTLSKEEAAVLLKLTGSISGDPAKSSCKRLTNGIYEELFGVVKIRNIVMLGKIEFAPDEPGL